MSSLLIYIVSLLGGISLLFLAVYFVITLSDLECDYINATQCCTRLNMWVKPEMILHGLMAVLQLVTLHWIIGLFNLPLMAWHIYRFVHTPSGDIGAFDPAEIHNRNKLKNYMKESMVKLGYHLIFFFVYLYSMILYVLSD